MEVPKNLWRWRKKSSFGVEAYDNLVMTKSLCIQWESFFLHLYMFSNFLECPYWKYSFFSYEKWNWNAWGRCCKSSFGMILSENYFQILFWNGSFRKLIRSEIAFRISYFGIRFEMASEKKKIKSLSNAKKRTPMTPCTALPSPFFFKYHFI